MWVNGSKTYNAGKGEIKTAVDYNDTNAYKKWD